MYPDIEDSILLYATMAAMEGKSTEDVIKFISGVTKNNWNANIWPRMIDFWSLHSVPEIETDQIISNLSQIGTVYLPFQYDSPFSRLQMSSSIFSDYRQEFSLESEEVDKSEFSGSHSSLKETLEKDYPLLFIKTEESCISSGKSTSEEAELKIVDKGKLPKPVAKNDYPELESLCPSDKSDYMDTIILAKDFLHKNGLKNVNFNDIESLDDLDWRSINAYTSSLRKSERSKLISYVYSGIYRENPQQGSIYKAFFDKGFFVKEADAEFLSVIMRSKPALELISRMKLGSYIEEDSGMGLPLLSLISNNSHLALQSGRDSTLINI
ncbi:hypothetical protein [Lacimicrobium alkaliphilum]|nr:hypothetical protein [Lacimicrobium alkaliphilum]